MSVYDLAEPRYLVALSAAMIDLQPMQAIRAIFALRCYTDKLSIYTDTHSNPNLTALLNQFADWLDMIEVQIAYTAQDTHTRAIILNEDANQDDRL